MTIEKRSSADARRELAAIIEEANAGDFAVVAWCVNGPGGRLIAEADELGIDAYEIRLAEQREYELRQRYLDSLL